MVASSAKAEEARLEGRARRFLAQPGGEQGTGEGGVGNRATGLVLDRDEDAGPRQVGEGERVPLRDPVRHEAVERGDGGLDGSEIPALVLLEALVPGIE